MVRVLALEVIDVKRHAGVIDKSLEKLPNELAVKLPDHRSGEATSKVQPRTSGQIQNHSRKRFIERNTGLTVTYDAFFVPQSLLERLTNDNSHVFDRMVTINVQISRHLDGQIHQPVPGNLLEHVIEKPDSCFNGALTRAVKLEPHLNLRFLCIAGNDCMTHQR